jgi:hypothetical protein
MLLDENIIVSQVQLLRSQGVRCRHVGHDFESQGIQDDNILPVLHRLRRPTLFTRDLGLYGRLLCHPNYCIVCLEVRESDVATFARRVPPPQIVCHRFGAHGTRHQAKRETDPNVATKRAWRAICGVGMTG